MSSILDALEKIEATGGPRAPSGGAAPGPGPGGRWRTLALVGVAIVAGAAGTALVLELRDPHPAASEPTVIAQATAPVAPAAEAPPSTIAASPPAMPGTTPPPLAVTGPTMPPPSPPAPIDVPPAVPAAGATPAPAPPIPAPHAAAPVPAPAGNLAERPWGADPDAPRTPPSTAAVAATFPAVPTTLPVVRTSPPTPAVSEPPGRAAPRRLPPGAPRLRVSFLVYSAVPARRSVALTIEGGGLTTLHEGDETNGVQVVQIHPDRVEVRWQGDTFTLEVRS